MSSPETATEAPTTPPPASPAVKTPKGKLRPQLPDLSTRKAALDRLAALDEWTEAPEKPPAAPPAKAPARAKKATEAPAPAVAPAHAPKAAKKPKKPWEEPSPDAEHALFVRIPKRLLVKLDVAWKGKRYKSMKEMVVITLTDAADRMLKELGELE